MTAFRGAWDEREVAAFLDTPRPLRLSVRRPDGSPWIVTLWYRYDDGVFECATSANADVVRYLRAEADVAFDVSTNDPPYRGVRGNGTASVDTDADQSLLRALVARYLGGTDSTLAERLLAEGREEARIVIRPARVYSWDYTDRMPADAA